MFSGAIAACFIFSMGNKPRASKWKYKSAAIFFAALSAYMIVAAIVCAVHVARLSDEHGALYAQMKLSVIATIGLWVTSSILALDPWHILTSGLAYVLLSPAYIIILNT
jgi:chitin synthase